MTLRRSNQSIAELDKWILLPLVFALFLRMVRLESAALWLDETFTSKWVSLPWPEMLRATLADNHLPFYFVLVKAWSAAFGNTPGSLRLFSVLSSLAVIPLSAAAANLISGKSAARWAAWLTALAPYLLHHAQEARMYSFLGSLAALNFYLLVRFATGRSRYLGLGFLAVNFALLATHYYAIFLIATQYALLLFLFPSRWRAWLPSALGSGAFLIGPILAAKYLATPHAGGSYEGMGLIALPGMVWAMLTGYTLIPTSAELHQNGLRTVIGYVPVALLVLAIILVVSLSALRTLARTASMALLVPLAGILVGPLVMSFLFDIGVNPRYAMTGIPHLMIFLACGLAVLAKQRPGKFAAAALLTVMTVAGCLHLRDPGHGREDVLAAGEWLERNVPIEEEILITSEELAILARFHWPNRRFLVYPQQKIIVDRGNVADITNALPFHGQKRAIYMVGRAWLSDPRDLLTESLGKTYQACDGVEVRGIRVFCITPVRRID